MIKYECIEDLPFSTDEVFAEGIRRETWPLAIPGLTLEPQDEVIALGGLIRVGLSIPNVPSIGMDARVQELNDGEGVYISGKSRLARATLAFALRPGETNELTYIHYALEVELSRLCRTAEPIIRAFTNQAIPRFTTEYKENVSHAILSRRSTIVDRAA